MASSVRPLDRTTARVSRPHAPQRPLYRTLPLIVMLLAGCGEPASSGRDAAGEADGSDGDAVPPTCAPDSARCFEGTFQRCVAGAWELVERCEAAGRLCDEALGCIVCRPGRNYCDGDRSMLCDADGLGGTEAEDCAATEGAVCDPLLGVCVNLCAAAAAEHSNVGCEYWAVDLDNWYGTDALNPDASAEQFSLVVTNPNTIPATVTVEINEAEPGEPLALVTVAEVPVVQGELVQIDLAQREVDGSVLNQNDGTGTALTSRAYRVTSTVPIVAYQFNPVYQMHTNDASILLPTAALDTDYWAMGYPGIGIAANPLNPSSTNYSFLAIVGTQEGTEVSVTLTSDVAAGGPLADWTAAGTTVTATLGPFDVWNLEGHCPAGMGILACMSSGVTDFTGTRIEASAPVAVFAGNECVNVTPPSCGGGCCCDHLEDQIVPASALGTKFVAAHSAFRGGSEPDVWRVLADDDGTEVTTSLPAPWDFFTLDRGAFVEFEARSSFVVTSTGPLLLGQYLVSQECTSAGTGDPSLTTFPPIEQFRTGYMFLVPATFNSDYAVVARPADVETRLDDLLLPDDHPNCTQRDAGAIDGVDWEVVECRLEDGSHRLDAAEPVGLAVYGYGPAGSYAYFGGANVERINIPF